MFKNDVGAVIIGGHFQGLGLIRSLAEKGVPTILIDHGPCIARPSRYVHRFYKCPKTTDTNRFIQFLLWLGHDSRYKGWVLSRQMMKQLPGFLKIMTC